MITLRYEKRYPFTAVSHIDVLRVMNRVFSRAGLKMKYSGGFNPHALIYFSPPVSVGIESLCEYVTVAAEDPSEDITEKLRSVSPEGLCWLKAYDVEKNPNFAATVAWAEYEIRGADVEKLTEKALKEASASGYIISYTEKENEVLKDTGGMVKSLGLEKGVLKAVIACGNKNLRADRFGIGLMKNNGLGYGDLTYLKTRMFDENMLSDEKMLEKFIR